MSISCVNIEVEEGSRLEEMPRIGFLGLEFWDMHHFSRNSDN